MRGEPLHGPGREGYGYTLAVAAPGRVDRCSL